MAGGKSVEMPISASTPVGYSHSALYSRIDIDQFTRIIDFWGQLVVRRATVDEQALIRCGRGQFDALPACGKIEMKMVSKKFGHTACAKSGRDKVLTCAHR